LDLLRQAGVEVVSGILGDECADLNLIFNHWIVHRQPLFAAKVATTLCGRIATRSGHSQWITGAAAREDVHRWRRYFPAIATGSGTVLADNPHLTARLPELDEHCPRRFVMDRSLSTVLEPLPHVYGAASARPSSPAKTPLRSASASCAPKAWAFCACRRRPTRRPSRPSARTVSRRVSRLCSSRVADV
jgi:hypothetical protein